MDYGIFNVRTYVNACDCTRGCPDTVRESALKDNSGRKIPCCTGESNLRRMRAGPMLYQPICIPSSTPTFISVDILQTRHSCIIVRYCCVLGDVLTCAKIFSVHYFYHHLKRPISLFNPLHPWTRKFLMFYV